MIRCLALLVVGFVFTSAAHGTISVGEGGQLSLGEGRIDLAGGDLQIQGSVNLESGSIDAAGSVIIDGTLNGGAGEITAFGDWINSGSFNAGTSTVRLMDSVGGDAEIRGASNFHALSMTSSAGGSFTLQARLIQQISQSLTILGTPAQPVQIRSDQPPEVAFVRLQQGGIQDITSVGVSNVFAIGVPLAPDETNQGGTGNDFGWFGKSLQSIPIPTLSVYGLLILILAFLVIGLKRRTPQTH